MPIDPSAGEISFNFCSRIVPALLPRYGCTVQPFEGICAKAIDVATALVSRAIILSQKGCRLSLLKLRTPQVIIPIAIMNPPIPSVCSSISDVQAPGAPAQFFITCPDCMPAVFHDGSPWL